MGTQDMLIAIRRHTIAAIFQVMRNVVEYRKGGKHLKKNALNLKNALARPPVYDRAYSEVISNTAPGNPVGITKSSSILLFVEPDKGFLGQSTKVEETKVLTIFRKKSMKKVRSQSKLAPKITAVHIT